MADFLAQLRGLQSPNGKRTMIWADRFAVSFALLISVLACLITLLALNSVSPDHPLTPSDFGHMVVWVGKAELYAALPMWIVLRIVDFMFGGPQRRIKKLDSLNGQ